ncbi:MAG: hypothetical protein DWP95_08870 [Proteobacteria bacterium]|nr:MAG: hypothetical protein DWP95_08870 [Pseudomonadota bacterium]
MKPIDQQFEHEQAQRFVDRYFHLHREDILSIARQQKASDRVIEHINTLLDSRNRQRTQANIGQQTEIRHTMFESFTIDSYQITELIAEGGMSAVYRAHKLDSQAQKDVAIKLIPPHLMTNKLRRLFIDELETLSYLHHPHIVDLHHGGVSEQGIPYFVMELVHEARPITDYVQDNGLSQNAVIDLFITLAKTLDYAHKNHIIHRDLKPNNVLVDGFGHLKVVDFGIAAIARQTVETQAYTQAYSPPEQIQNQDMPVSFATDIYGFCSVLLECLCPDNNDFRPGWQKRCLLNSPLDSDLKKIIRKCIQFLPQDRYHDFDSLVTDLSLWQQKLPLASFDSSLWDNTRKFFLRQPIASSMLVVGFVLLSAGLAFSFWQLDRLKSQTAKTEQVRNLFFNAIEQTDPDIRQGRSITIEQMLQQALRNVRENPINDPQLSFEFNNLLGTALLKAGDYSNAIKQLRSAQDIKNSDINNTMALAEAHIKLQNYKQAEQLLNQIDHKNIANNSVALFNYYELKGKIADFRVDFVESAKLYQLARQQALQLNHPLLMARIIREQADSLLLQDRNQEALEELNQAIDDAHDLWGDNHSATLGLRMARVETLQNLSVEDITFSVTELNDLIPRLQQFYHPQHPLVAKMKLLQSSANQALGHLPIAEQQAREALDIAVNSLGEHHALTGRIYMVMARVLLSNGDIQGSLAYSRSAVDSYRRFYGENHNETLQQKTSLAAILLQHNHFQEALNMAQEIYQQQLQALGAEHRATQYAQMVLARAYNGLGQYEKGHEYAENCYQIAQKVDASSMLSAGCGLALENSLFNLQKWSKAQQLAQHLLKNPIIANHPVYNKMLNEHLQTIANNIE